MHVKHFLTRNKIIIASLSLLIVVTLTWWAMTVTSPISYSLNEDLRYIGKKDYGCYLLCDSSPQSTYYYATDMSVDDVISHFKNAQPDQKPRLVNTVTDFTLTNKNGQDISIYYYANKEEITKKYHLSSTSKAFILSIPSFDYQAAKAAL